MEERNHARIGSGDVCSIRDWTPERVAGHLREAGVEILVGPVEKTGALGPIVSIYFNDPDGNLIEVSSCPGRSPCPGEV
jgi:catechol 2,3-dioxygenase-like lactoylglutathione lyase family enzyme